MIDKFQTKRLSRLDLILILSGITAPVILFFAVLIAGLLQPEYSHISQAISELGARGTPFSAVLNYAGLMPAGILTFAFSLAMFRRLKKPPAFCISSSLVAIVGIARCFAGVFPCDPGCFPIITITGRLHALSGLIALFAGSLAPLVMAFGLRRGYSQTFFYLSMVLGVASLILFTVLVSQLLIQYFGGIQRLLLILTYTWVIVVAVNIGNVDH
jgi:hypothetical membrane protein